jgi:regulator of sirC expression with transglutaminase-like and TPR domain
MSNNQQLPHLIKLLDDDSEVVRENVLAELSSFGQSLKNELNNQNIILNPKQQQLIADLLSDYHRRWLRKEWNSWLTVRDDKLKLETALGLLDGFLHERNFEQPLSPLLDSLSEEYDKTHTVRDVQLLSRFLFTVKEIHGADQQEYYNPLNSSISHAIIKKQGLPITLVSLYILVGHRLGLDIEGCNYPGHFLALAFTKHHKHVVDCFNNGQFLNEKEFIALTKSAPIEMKDVFQLECDATTIITRVLRNLINSYQKYEDHSNELFMTELVTIVENQESAEEEDEEEE